jgi:hypothetical protein
MVGETAIGAVLITCGSLTVRSAAARALAARSNKDREIAAPRAIPPDLTMEFDDDEKANIATATHIAPLKRTNISKNLPA